MATPSAPVRAKPILVEILTYAPTQFFHCQHCEIVWQQIGAAGNDQPPRDAPVRPGEPNTGRDHSFGSTFHQEQLDSSIPEDLKKEYAALCDWVRETVDALNGRVVFKIIDVASMEGLLKAVRYRARRYPAFIVEGKEKYIGVNFEKAREIINKQLH